MDIRTDKESYKIPPPARTGKTSTIPVKVTIDYKDGDPQHPLDWVAFVPAGQVVGPTGAGLKDSHNNASQWDYTDGVDFVQGLSCPCYDKATKQNYGAEWEVVVFAANGYEERGRKRFIIEA